MRVFDLRYEGARKAALHPELKGLPLIGRGTFSAVFDAGCDILKLTIDGSSIGLLKSNMNVIEAFPKLWADLGVVGNYKKGAKIHLARIEKLRDVQPRSFHAKRAAALCEIVNDLLPKDWVAKGRASIEYPTVMRKAASAAAKDGRFDPHIINALLHTGFYLDHHERRFGLDFHAKNVMVRSQTGQLVLVDPVADYSLYDFL